MSFAELPNYTPPIQARAIDAEYRMLSSFNLLLKERSLAQLTIDDIASKANVTKSSFFQRFGDKDTALLILYRKYCLEIVDFVEQATNQIGNLTSSTIEKAFLEIVMSFHKILTQHIAVNKAMNLKFAEAGEVHNDTKLIFLKSAELIDKINKADFFDVKYNPSNTWTANQVLVTLTYNYSTGAMSAMPKDRENGCKIISNLVLRCLMSDLESSLD